MAGMNKLLIIADDFTGALDTGVQFIHSGARILVKNLLCGHCCSDAFSSCDVLVLQTNTRHLAPEAAYETIGEICKAARMTHKPPVIYKKTDSALRGNIGAELSAVLENGPCQAVFFIPAYPKVNRIAKNGVQYIDAAPIHESAFASDKLNPIKHSYIPDIIHESCSTPVYLVPETQNLYLLDTHERGIYVFDATTDARLMEIAIWMRQVSIPYAVAGCAGFAEHLSGLFSFTQQTSDFTMPDAKLLVANGSIHQVSLTQVKFAQELGFRVVHLSEHFDFKTNGQFEPSQEALTALLDSFNVSKGLILVTYDANAFERQEISCSNYGPDEASIVSGNFGKIIAGMLRLGLKCILAVTGGDILCNVVHYLGCNEVEPLAEIERGVVLARMDSRFGEQFIVTKSGGMGSNDVYHVIDRYLKKHQNRGVNVNG